jgi:hypothetical protein
MRWSSDRLWVFFAAHHGSMDIIKCQPPARGVESSSSKSNGQDVVSTERTAPNPHHPGA